LCAKILALLIALRCRCTYDTANMVPYTGIVNMHRYHLQSALLPRGFARDVIATVSDDGFITEVEAAPSDGGEAPSGAERVDWIVLPDLPNAHSHAFQRAMAG